MHTPVLLQIYTLPSLPLPVWILWKHRRRGTQDKADKCGKMSKFE
jgi:hypothetical protein